MLDLKGNLVTSKDEIDIIALKSLKRGLKTEKLKMVLKKSRTTRRCYVKRDYRKPKQEKLVLGQWKI